MPYKKRIYKKHGIAEALCQLSFVTPPSWDLTVYGAMSHLLKEKGYSVRDEFRPVLVPSSLSDEPSLPVAGPSIMRFKLPDGSGLYQLAPDIFVFNRIGVYDGWDSFKPEIMEAAGLLQRVVEPQRYVRLALRYINRLEFDLKEDIRDFVTAYPNVEEVWGERGPFTMRQEFVGPQDARLGLVVGYANNQVPGRLSIVIDLEYFQLLGDEWTLDDLNSDLDAAHEAISQAFEGCVTDSLRARMGEVKNAIA